VGWGGVVGSYVGKHVVVLWCWRLVGVGGCEEVCGVRCCDGGVQLEVKRVVILWCWCLVGGGEVWCEVGSYVEKHVVLLWWWCLVGVGL
jgi:hypothetical protein